MLRHVSVESCSISLRDQPPQLDDALVPAPATLALDPLDAAVLKIAKRERLHALGRGDLTLGDPFADWGFVSHRGE